MKDEEKLAQNIDGQVIIENVLRTLSVNAPTFARNIGVNYQRVFDIQRGRVKKFSPGMVNKICTVYPQINKAYLYSGEGDILTDVPETDNSSNSSLDSKNMSEFMGMSSKVLNLFEQLQERDRDLSIKANVLMEKESSLNERERLLNDREAQLNKRELELTKLALSLEKA